MKAKYFTSGGKQEIRLMTGKQYFSSGKETKPVFVARITKQVEKDELDTLELSEVTAEKLKAFKTPALLDAHKKEGANSVYALLIAEVLESRNVKAEAKTEKVADTSKADAAKAEREAKAEAAKAAKAEKAEATAKAKAEKAEATAAAKAEKEAAKAKAKEEKDAAKAAAKAAKPVREIFKGYTPEEIEKAKASVGYHATFKPFNVPGRDETVSAVLKGIVEDKRVSRMYFRAYDAAKNLYYVQINNKTLVIGEKAPEVVRVNKEEREAAKAQAKAEKEAARAQAKADKETAKAEKAAEAAKAKAEKAAEKAKEAADKAAQVAADAAAKAAQIATDAAAKTEAKADAKK